MVYWIIALLRVALINSSTATARPDLFVLLSLIDHLTMFCVEDCMRIVRTGKVMEKATLQVWRWSHSEAEEFVVDASCKF